MTFFHIKAQSPGKFSVIFGTCDRSILKPCQNHCGLGKKRKLV